MFVPIRFALCLCLSLLVLATFLRQADAQDADDAPMGLAMHGTAPRAPLAADRARPDAPKGGEMKTAAIGTFDTLNPFSLKGKAAQGLSLTYDRLMARSWDDPFTLYPLIARRVEVSENRDKMTIFLDPQARFHDGSPVTAEDVLFSLETLRTQGRPNMRRVYTLVKVKEKIDLHIIRLTFGDGYDRETALILAMMPVLSKAFWSKQDFNAGLLTPPLTNGPYRIAQVAPGHRIVYERVPDYWAANHPPMRGHANFDRIVYDYFRDDSVAFEAFKTGALTFRRETDPAKWESAYDFPAARDGRVQREALPHGRTEPLRALIFNTRRPPFDDPRVREALSLLPDFEWMNRSLFHGRMKRTRSYYPNADLAARGPPSPEEKALLDPWKGKIPESVFGPVEALTPQDSGTSRRTTLRRADALLREAGWPVVDGLRRKAGKPLAFQILVSTADDEKIALSFVQILKRMGIRADVRAPDSASFLDRLQDYDYDMVVSEWLSSLSPGTEQALYWGCAAAQEKGRMNYAGICHPAIDSLIADLSRAPTREALIARARALDRLLLAGHYVIPLFHTGADFVSWHKGLNRPNQTPLYGLIPEVWWMDPAPQPKTKAPAARPPP